MHFTSSVTPRVSYFLNKIELFGSCWNFYKLMCSSFAQRLTSFSDRPEWTIELSSFLSRCWHLISSHFPKDINLRIEYRSIHIAKVEGRKMLFWWTKRTKSAKNLARFKIFSNSIIPVAREYKCRKQWTVGGLSLS